MSIGTERLSDIFDSLPGGRGPSLDAYLAPTDDESSSENELDAAAFVAWMKQNAEAARRERQQLLVKETADKQSTVVKRSSRQRGSAGRPLRRSARQSGQGELSLMDKSTRRSTKKQSLRKSFDVSEIGGRKISLEVQETDSDTEVGPPSPSGHGTPGESCTQLLERSDNPEEPLATHQLEGSNVQEGSPGSQLLERSGSQQESPATQQLGGSGIPEGSPGSQLLEGSGISPEAQLLEKSCTPEGSLGTQLLERSDNSEEPPATHQLEELDFPEESPDTQLQDGSEIPVQSSGSRTERSNTSAFKGPRPSYLEPNDQATATYIEVSSLKFDSASSDDQGLSREGSRRVHRDASRQISRYSQDSEDPHSDSCEGDQNTEMEVQDTTVKEGMQTATLRTVSAKKRAAKTTAKKRKIRKICMPKKGGTTSKKQKPQHTETSTSTKKELHLTISPLVQTAARSMTKSSVLSRSPSRGRSIMHSTKQVVLSPKSSAKRSRELSGDVSPVASLTPPTALPSLKARSQESSKPTWKTLSKKKLASSSRVRSSPGVDSPSNASAAASRHESMKSMRENAISIIASITEDEAHVDYSLSGDSQQANTGSTLPVSRRRQSDASVVSGYGGEQTPSNTFVVTLGERCDQDSDYGDTMVAGESDAGSSENDSRTSKGTNKKKKGTPAGSLDDGSKSSKGTGKKRKRTTALCYKKPHRERNKSVGDASVELSQLTESQSEEATGSEEEGDEYTALTDISAVASKPVMLDGYTPLDKGIPLNRSQLLKTLGGHTYKFSPVKGRKGVTPGRRRTKRTRVPVLPSGETYAYTVDENVLHTVAGRVRPLEERNEEKQQRERKPKPSIRRKQLNCLDMAFSETQDEEESVATFPLQTVDGDQLEVEFLRHLSVCPKKTLSGSDAVKSDPVIISPMYANESCSVGCIFINAKSAKPYQVTTGASLVFLLMAGRIEVELQSDDQNYVKEIKPVTRFWIPEDVTYSIHNVDQVPAELIYVRLKQQS